MMMRQQRKRNEENESNAKDGLFLATPIPPQQLVVAYGTWSYLPNLMDDALFLR